MDIDVLAGSVATLKKNGYKILQDAAFLRNLRTYGIDEVLLNDPQKAKHTETTQRFRFSLITTTGLRLPTKIEFSRGVKTEAVTQMELVDSEIALKYNTLAYYCLHYPGESAVIQKIQALAGRSITQARDVFDLGILYSGGFAAGIKSAKGLNRIVIEQAAEALFSLSYEDYQGQVIEYLDLEHRKPFESLDSWQRLQNTVFGLLENA